jgi:hypothetical protein
VHRAAPHLPTLRKALRSLPSANVINVDDDWQLRRSKKGDPGIGKWRLL